MLLQDHQFQFYHFFRLNNRMFILSPAFIFSVLFIIFEIGAMIILLTNIPTSIDIAENISTEYIIIIFI